MPEESQSTTAPQTGNTPILDKPVPNPLAKNPNFFTHKVVAAVGIILVGLIVILFGAAIYFNVDIANLFTTPNNEANTFTTSSVKQTTTTSSALVSTKKISETIKFYDSSFNHATLKGDLHSAKFNMPKDWTIKEDNSKNKNNGHYYSINGSSNFLIEISEIPGGIGFGCPGDAQPPADLILATEKITSNNQDLFIRITGSLSKKQVEKAYLAFTSGWLCADGIVELKIPGQSTNGINFNFSMSFQKNVPKNQFLNSAEYKAAKEILSSLTIVN